MRSDATLAPLFTASARHSVAIGRQLLAAEKAEQLQKKKIKIEKKQAKQDKKSKGKKEAKASKDKHPGIKKVLQSKINEFFLDQVLPDQTKKSVSKIEGGVSALVAELKENDVPEGMLVFGDIDLMKEDDFQKVVECVNDFRKEVIRYVWNLYNRNSDKEKNGMLDFAINNGKNDQKEIEKIAIVYVAKHITGDSKYSGVNGTFELLKEHPMDIEVKSHTKDISRMALATLVIAMENLQGEGDLSRFCKMIEEPGKLEGMVIGAVAGFITGKVIKLGALSFIEKKIKKSGLPNYLTDDFIVENDVKAASIHPDVKVNENGAVEIVVRTKDPKTTVVTPDVTPGSGGGAGDSADTGGSGNTAIAQALKVANEAVTASKTTPNPSSKKKVDPK